MRRPFAALRARCVARPRRGAQKLALRAQTSAHLLPPGPVRLADAWRQGNRGAFNPSDGSTGFERM